jgi:hypothetical protein
MSNSFSVSRIQAGSTIVMNPACCSLACPVANHLTGLLWVCLDRNHVYVKRSSPSFGNPMPLSYQGLGAKLADPEAYSFTP